MKALEHRFGRQSFVSRQLAEVKELIRPHYLRWVYFRLNKANCPQSFKDCWLYPAEGIEAFPQNLEPPVEGFQDLLFFPMADWHTCIQRSQHLATAFASAGHRCFYVNPHLGREFPTLYSHSKRIVVSTLAPRIRELHVRLRREPVFHHRCLRPEENALVVEAADELLRGASSQEVTLVVSFPLWAEAAIRLREMWGCKIVYDCHDLLSGFGNISEDLLAAERVLLEESDLVVFSAKWLLDRHADENPEIRHKALIVRNAATVADFDAAFEERHRRGAAASGKTIGYVGSLESWFNVELVKSAALARPDWRFVLIGRVGSENLAALRQIPNVSFMGYVPYQELPSHLAKMDVAIIPFIRTPLILATNPVKLYEYFACGLPVVASRLPELEPYSELVRFADNPEEFVTEIENAIRTDTPELHVKRREAVVGESWAARYAEISAAIALISQHPASSARTDGHGKRPAWPDDVTETRLDDYVLANEPGNRSEGADTRHKSGTR